MKVELGFTTSQQFWKASYGQGSWQTQTSQKKFIVWDGVESLEDLVYREFAKFIEKAEKDKTDRCHCVTLTHIRLGGQVVVPTEKQEVYSRTEIIEA
jgi:hypothetical protein